MHLQSPRVWRKPLLVVLIGTLALVGSDFASADPTTKPKPTPDVRPISQRIDALLVQKLSAEKISPAGRCSDAEFLRRVSLDITGIIPSAEKATAFLDSTDPEKRSKLIEELLASPRYGKHMADTWQRLMLPRESDNRRLKGAPLTEWLETKFNANTPWDVQVRELLTATGTQDKNGAVTYFLGNQQIDKITDSVSKLFLGVQLQCAQCHNHPFTSYKQDDYWAMAAFFSKVRPDNVNKAAKNGDSPGLNESGKGKAKLPESARTVPAQFLQGEKAKLSSSEPYRPALATWLTSPQNPFFAKAMVNRTWAQFFGRGFVMPVDDMHEGNTPSHPELLKELTQSFTESGFDVKHLIRAICNSEAYQRSSKSPGENVDERLFASMAMKPLTPEQLYDSLTSILGSTRPNRPDKPMGKGLLAGPREQFVAFFQADENACPTEYHAGIPQVLRLMNSPQTNNSLAVVAAMARSGPNPAPGKAIEQLFLTTLSRRPTNEEMLRVRDYFGKKTEPRQALGDILWALLNSSEFALNH